MSRILCESGFFCLFYYAVTGSDYILYQNSNHTRYILFILYNESGIYVKYEI